MVSFPKVSHAGTYTQKYKHTQRAEGKQLSLIENNQAERNLIATVWPEGGVKRDRGKEKKTEGEG